MKTYTKPLAEVFELRVTENIAAGNAKANARWDAVDKVMVSEYSLYAVAGSPTSGNE